MTTSKKKRNIIPREKRGLRYPVEFVAAELGVDRKRLDRACEAANFHLNGSGIKFSEAYDALTQRSESEAAIRRKRIADANSAEIDAIEKAGQFVYKVDHENCLKDAAVQHRIVIESASHVSMESRRKLVEASNKIRPMAVESSNRKKK